MLRILGNIGFLAITSRLDAVMSTSSPQAIATKLLTSALQEMPDVIALANLFDSGGYEFSVVGGPVRDLILDRPITDLDFTTNANPEQIISLVEPWADNVWDVGIAFGTVGVRKKNFQAEITTYRSEVYRHESRKPEVKFGTTL